MCDGPSFLRRPRKSSEDYWEFVNLAGEIDVFDVAKAGYPWFGRRIEGPDGVVCCDREDELLYPTSDGRHVLVYWDDSSLGGPPKPWPDRELSPEDASLWFMLGQHEIPAPLKPVPLRDPAQDPSSRLNREWTPSDPASPPSPGEERNAAEQSLRSNPSVPLPSKGENVGTTVVLLPLETSPPPGEKEHRIVQQIKELIANGEWGRSKVDILEMVQPMAKATFYRIMRDSDARMYWECYTRRISNPPRG